MKSKLCWMLAAFFALTTGLMGYAFLFKGSVAQAPDGRKALLLSPAERDLVLAEMRGFLVTVQEVLARTRKGEMEQAALAARKVGMAAQMGVPASLIGKLPADFKMLGFDTHSRFDQLALDAEQLGDADHTLDQLATLMQNCVGCHAAFRIDPTPSAP